jgi:hypothetical protein
VHRISSEGSRWLGFPTTIAVGHKANIGGQFVGQLQQSLNTQIFYDAQDSNAALLSYVQQIFQTYET